MTKLYHPVLYSISPLYKEVDASYTVCGGLLSRTLSGTSRRAALRAAAVPKVEVATKNIKTLVQPLVPKRAPTTGP